MKRSLSSESIDLKEMCDTSALIRNFLLHFTLTGGMHSSPIPFALILFHIHCLHYALHITYQWKQSTEKSVLTTVAELTLRRDALSKSYKIFKFQIDEINLISSLSFPSLLRYHESLPICIFRLILECNLKDRINDGLEVNSAVENFSNTTGKASFLSTPVDLQSGNRTKVLLPTETKNLIRTKKRLSGI
uniref:Uncharacterized protein n=1 Tax=Glossina austeni TaxID=7395 RepID=A0A1A9UUU5_GLOAU